LRCNEARLSRRGRDFITIRYRIAERNQEIRANGYLES
jgi:hypothetical protein